MNIFHPTQKPVSFLEYLVKTYTKKGDLILDNCMGSGTTTVACLNTERYFIGFETNAEYYTTAIDRIQNNVTQLDLFRIKSKKGNNRLSLSVYRGILNTTVYRYI